MAAHGLSLDLGLGLEGGDRRGQSRPIAEDKISTQLETSVLVRHVMAVLMMPPVVVFVV